jgi:tetratricopeptide (TPR) repeat protein
MKGTVLCGLVAGAILCLCDARGQSARSLISGGNDLYRSEKFNEAEEKYRKALEKERGLTAGTFNLGNALYKQGKLDESLRAYEDVATSKVDPAVRAEALYNSGNARLKGEQYQEAVRDYIESLKLQPNDQDAKYNLSYALEKLRQQQQQQQQQKQDKNDKDKQKQNQQKQQDQQERQQQQQQKQDQQQQQQDQQQMAPQEKRMSKQDAERILEVLKNSERDVQKKLRVRQATRAKTDKDW